MSRNLIKQFFTTDMEERRVIDTEELLRRRQVMEAKVEPQEPQSQPDNDGFLAGLNAKEVDVPSDEDLAGNVIKVQEEILEQQKILEQEKLRVQEEIRTMLEQAQADAQAILDGAQSEASGIIESAKAQAEAEKKNVLEQSRKQGYEAGQAKANSELEEAKRQLEEKARQLDEEYQQQLNELEPKFVDTITSVYEHIFHVELGSYRGILEYLISNTMHSLEAGHNFLIHVSKEDYSYVYTQKRQILSGAVSAGDTVDVVEDMTLEKNECLIETDGGIFDCGLGTQMSELKKRLMLLAWSREE